MKWIDFIKNRWMQLVPIGLVIVGVYRAIFIPDFSYSGGPIEVVRVGYHEENFYAVKVDPREDDLRLVWADADGERYGSIEMWKQAVERDGKRLEFAMNGGMYERGGAAKGLFIEEGVEKVEIDLLEKGYGNFYMQPNGVFFVKSNGVAGVCQTGDFGRVGEVRFATQSGPMLLIKNKVNEHFRDGSDSVHIRNGVGVFEDGSLLFAMSKQKVNFYDFARFFHNSGCVDALYLDGFVSRMYAPSAGVEQEDGDFGVMIGVVGGE